MPLSDHEQRLLDQIERALYADDPKFASAVRSTDLRSHYRRRATRSLALTVLGLVVLVVGAVLSHWYIGVAGFLIMLLAAMRAVTAVKRAAGRAPERSGRLPGRAGRAANTGAGATKPGGATPRGGTAPPNKGTSGSAGAARWRERLEERWRRRWEDPS